MFLTSDERDDEVSHAAHPGPRPCAAREGAGLVADECRGVVAIDVVMTVIDTRIDKGIEIVIIEAVPSR